MGYIGKSPNSTKEIEPGVLLRHVEKLVKKTMSWEDINSILKKMGTEYGAWPITRIIINLANCPETRETFHMKGAEFSWVS